MPKKLVLADTETGEFDGVVKDQLNAAYVAAGDVMSFAMQGHIDATERSLSMATQVIGDSTGNATDEWVYQMAQAFATAHPEYTVRYRLYDDASSSYPQPTVIQTGTDGARSCRLDGTTLPAYGALAATSLYAVDVAELRITGDIDVRVKVSLDDWTPTETMAFASKYGQAGNRGWQFYKASEAAASWLIFSWTADGTNVIPASRSTVPFNPPDGSVQWVRATLDVDNGSGGWTLNYYTSTDGSTWTQLGSTVTGSGATSIFASTQRLEVGGVNGQWPLVGNVYEAEIRSGINGQLVHASHCDQWGKLGNAVMVGAPVLDVFNASVPGMGIDAFLTRVNTMTPPAGQVLTIFSDSHNDQGQLGPALMKKWDQWFAAVRARLPYSGYVALSQNPRLEAGAFTQAHHQRRTEMAAWARRNLVGYVDLYPAFYSADPELTSLLEADLLHPNTAGKAVWLGEVLAQTGFAVPSA